MQAVGAIWSYGYIDTNMLNIGKRDRIQSNFSPSDGSNTMDGSNWFESPVNFPYFS
jgi:hypothetical protein